MGYTLPMNPGLRQERVVDTHTKALHINLDQRRYGTFAEIGAGQEVVRWFFRAGGAAGTIAKSMSAYDMAVSDAIYGKAERYVCRPRLEAMLGHEHKLNLDRLSESRGATTARIAVDMFECSGIEFRRVDNRLLSMKLVQLGLSGAAMFDPKGDVLQPSEVLRKRNVLVERGSFRPVCHVNIDMLRCANENFAR